MILNKTNWKHIYWDWFEEYCNASVNYYNKRYWSTLWKLTDD